MHLWFNGHKDLTSVGYMFECFLAESSSIKTFFFTRLHVYINLLHPLQNTAKQVRKMQPLFSPTRWLIIIELRWTLTSEGKHVYTCTSNGNNIHMGYFLVARPSFFHAKLQKKCQTNRSKMSG